MKGTSVQKLDSFENNINVLKETNKVLAHIEDKYQNYFNRKDENNINHEQKKTLNSKLSQKHSEERQETRFSYLLLNNENQKSLLKYNLQTSNKQQKTMVKNNINENSFSAQITDAKNMINNFVNASPTFAE